MAPGPSVRRATDRVAESHDPDGVAYGAAGEIRERLPKHPAWHGKEEILCGSRVDADY
jgi:hypothetical protein